MHGRQHRQFHGACATCADLDTVLAVAISLTRAQLDAQRARIAASRDAKLVDGRALRRAEDAHWPWSWATEVLGRPYSGLRSVDWVDIQLLLWADGEDPAGVAAARDAERANAEAERVRRESDANTQHEAERGRWAVLRAQLPVPVFVGHNWTIGHYDGHVSGRDHIVVQSELQSGRLRRPPLTALCETPSKKASGHKDPLRALDRSPATAHDDSERIPTCRACLSLAERLAAHAPGR